MTMMWNEIFEQPDAIRKCRESNKNMVMNLSNSIKERKINSIIIAARGTSDHAAVYAKYILEILTQIPVSLSAPSVYTTYNKKLKLDNSLVIGISQSGKAEDVLEVIKSANTSGAITATITNFMDSPLAREAQFHLFCNAGLEQSVAATKTFITQIYLIAMLAEELTGDKTLAEELSELPKKIEETLKCADKIIERVQRYRFMNECFILSRGINYSVALESALKIQETNYVRAKAYATSDFYHGPFAMVTSDIPAIVFAPKGPSYNDVMEMIKKLKENNVELIIISNDSKALEMGECAFEIPDTENDMISPFFNIIIAQMFACQLALTKGLNPDKPRGLNKVTITR